MQDFFTGREDHRAEERCGDLSPTCRRHYGFLIVSGAMQARAGI